MGFSLTKRKKRCSLCEVRIAKQQLTERCLVLMLLSASTLPRSGKRESELISVLNAIYSFQHYHLTMTFDQKIALSAPLSKSFLSKALKLCAEETQK